MKHPAHPLSTATSRRAVLYLSGSLTAALTLTLALPVLPVAAAVIQDQSNSGTVVGAVYVNDARDRGQTFVAGVSGTLKSVRLNGCDVNDDTESLTIALYPASGEAPNSIPDVSGPPLAQQTFTGSPVSFLPPSSACTGNQGADFTITFDTPATITAGTAYTFTLDAAQDPSSVTGLLLASTAQGDYPRGNRSTLATGSSWGANPTRNLVFATFVDDGKDAEVGGEPLTLSLSSSCASGNPTGNLGTWIQLPASKDCTPPVDGPDATLLGWSTSRDFPVAIAKRQVDNGWGAYETFNGDGQLTSVFIPAGGWALVSSPNNLFAIWSE